MGAGSLCDVMTLRSSIVSHGAFAAVLLRVEQGQRSANDAFGSKPAQEPKDGGVYGGGKDDGEVCARESDKERWSIYLRSWENSNELKYSRAHCFA